MKHPVVKGLVIAFGSLVGLVLLLVLYVFVSTQSRMNRVYDVNVVRLELPNDSLSLANGRHQAIIRGCFECHGANLGGALVLDDPAIGYVEAPNITGGRGSVITADFTTDDWVRAIRHGVGKNLRALPVMPSEEYWYMGDKDLGDLIAYLKTVPKVDHASRPFKAGPVGRALVAFHKMPLFSAEVIDHEGPRPITPERGVTVEYGRYLGATCTGCHGHGLSGGPIPSGPPNWPPAMNITPDKATGIGNWSEADFVKTMRTGINPDNRPLSPVMPFSQFGQMTDDELTALYMYLMSVPVRPEGNR